MKEPRGEGSRVARGMLVEGALSGGFLGLARVGI